MTTQMLMPDQGDSMKIKMKGNSISIPPTHRIQITTNHYSYKKGYNNYKGARNNKNHQGYYKQSYDYRTQYDKNSQYSENFDVKSTHSK